MRLLERHVFAELLKTFLVLLTATTCLMVFVGVFSQMKEKGLGPAQIFGILPYIVPTLLPYTIPATLLLSVCVVYGRMSGDQEIIAAKAAGMNVTSLLWPSFFLGAMLSVTSLLLLDQVIPWAMRNIERFAVLATEDIILDMLRTQNQVPFKEQGITITVLDVRGRTLIQPTFRFAPNGKKAVTIQAREASLDFDVRGQQVILRLVHGFLDAPGENRLYLDDKEMAFPFKSRGQRTQTRDLRLREVEEELARVTKEAREARDRQTLETAFLLTSGNFSRLTEPSYKKHGAEERDQCRQHARLRTEYHNRFATSSTCFFFVLLGSPFAVLMAKKQFLTTFLFCFLPILCVYYPVSMMSQNLSKTGSIDPLWAVWLANAVMLVAAVVCYRKVLQH